MDYPGNIHAFVEKHGVTLDQTCDLVGHILENCKNLQFTGLMTIGSFSHDYSTGLNPDFVVSTFMFKRAENLQESHSLVAGTQLCVYFSAQSWSDS